MYKRSRQGELSKCRSIINKWDEISAELLTLDCDIVCITEIWLSTNHNTSIYNIRGYHCLINNRPSKRGGGSLLLLIRYS